MLAKVFFSFKRKISSYKRNMLGTGMSTWPRRSTNMAGDPVAPQSAGHRSFAPGERGLEQSFGRAAVILNALSAAGETGLRFVDIVRSTGFSQTTAHRLIAALSEHGYVEQEAAGTRYFLGMRLAGWAFAAANRFGLAEIAHPVMQRLCEATEDTVYLTLRSGDMAICVSRIEGAYPIRALVVKPGDRRVLGLGAGSVALLAFLKDEAEIRRLLALPEQQAGRSARGVDEVRVWEWIAASRQARHTFVQDLVPGTSGIGFPIYGPAGDPIAALSLAAISDRLAQPRLDAVLRQVQAATAEIEERLRPILKSRVLP
jgi:DNA-binding IclR family transcriptional regulator